MTVPPQGLCQQQGLKFLDVKANHDLIIVTDRQSDIPKPNLSDINDIKKVRTVTITTTTATTTFRDIGI